MSIRKGNSIMITKIGEYDDYFADYLLDSEKEENQKKILQKMFPKAAYSCSPIAM